MSNWLKLFLAIFIIIFLAYAIHNVAKNKLSVKSALVWILMALAILISIIFVDWLAEVAQFIGVETLSNLMFFLGFIFLIFVCFNLHRTTSAQRKEISQLTQELSIIQNLVKKDKKSDGRAKKNH